MIMHKGKQVGFIQHNSHNIDKVMHNGNCVFEQGYLRDNNTITGDIVLDGTIGKSLKSWSITGNTVQDGTPSPDNPVEIQSVGERTKNLFDKNTADFKNLGVGNDPTSGKGTLVKNSITGTGVFSIKCETNTTYTIYSPNGNNIFVAFGDVIADIGVAYRGAIILNDETVTTITTDETAEYLYLYLVFAKDVEAGLTIEYVKDKVHVEIGSNTTPTYEPYGYKIPVVTRGKNLLKLKEGNYTILGVSITIANDVVTVKGTASGDGGRTRQLSYIVDLQPGTTYTLKRHNIKYGTSSIDVTTNYMSAVNGNVVVGLKPFTGANGTKVFYGINVMSGYTYDLSFQIELIEGSPISQYEPYQEPIATPIYLSEPLRKLGDYADTIEYIGNGQAKITRNIKSLTLTGTESWSLQSVNNYGIYNFQSTENMSVKNGSLVICNNLTTQITPIADTQTIGLHVSINGYIYLRVDDAIATDVDTLKSWLASKYESGSPVIVEYVLDTPVEETIEVPNIPTFKNSPTIRGMMTSLSVDTTIKPTATNVSFRSTNKYQRYISRYIDFDNNKMSTISGDFSNIRAFTNRRRCNVLDDGTISAFYGDDNYAEDGSNGQVMVYQPKFYYKVEPIRLEPIADSIGYHIREAIYSVSDIPLTGYKLHPAFINEAGNEVDYFCLSAYEGCAYDVSNSAYITNDSQTVDFTADTGDKLSSIANVKPMSGLTQQLTRPNAEKIAKNRGAGWHSYGIKQASANQMLMFIEYGNLQSKIGSGVTSISDNSSYNCSSYTGSTSSLGNTTGRASSTINEIGGTETTYTVNGRTSISYRGMENPYGNIWDIVYGINIHGDGTQRSGIPYICTDYNYAESKNSGNYVSAGFTTVNANGYIKAFGYGNPEYDWLFMGSDTGGTAGGIIGDYHYVTANLNGYRIALLGGFWYGGSTAGGFYWYLINGVGSRSRVIGARLCYIPQK